MQDVTIPEAKEYLRNYIENCNFNVEDEDTLDDATWELRDLCDEHGCSIDDLEPWEFGEVVDMVKTAPFTLEDFHG